jgi:hypothetical protein
MAADHLGAVIIAASGSGVRDGGAFSQRRPKIVRSMNKTGAAIPISG